MAGTCTEERRARAAEVARRVQPWTKSTGPRTPEGKAIASMNRYQGGKREKIRALHREGRALIKAFDEACRELEKRGIDFVAAPQAPSFTDEQLLVIVAEHQAQTSS